MREVINLKTIFSSFFLKWGKLTHEKYFHLTLLKATVPLYRVFSSYERKKFFNAVNMSEKLQVGNGEF